MNISNWLLFRKYKTKEDASWVMAGNQSFDKAFSICMRLTEHPAAEVRGQAVLDITSSDHDLDLEKEVVSVLASRIIHDDTLDVRINAVCSLIQQLGYSDETTLGLATYPDALRAISTWLNTAPTEQDLYLCNLNNLPDHFFWIVTNTEGSDEFIDAISVIACCEKKEASDRNWATIILARLKDRRCHDVLERLSTDSDSYVSGNAKKGLKQLETA